MRRISILLFTLVTFLVAAAWPQSHAPKKEPTIITFDPPGSILTEALDINPAGAITGAYADASNVNHGFLRAPDGSITTFDAPGAGTGPGQGTLTSTIDGLNPEGAIVGGYISTGSIFSGTAVIHGAVRAPDGTITTFDVPGAGTSSGQGTIGGGLNAPGDVAGIYIDAGNVNHGLLCSKQGALTTFDVPDAGTGAFQGTFPAQNNSANAITGYYIDSSNVFHGFLRK